MSTLFTCALVVLETQRCFDIISICSSLVIVKCVIKDAENTLRWAGIRCMCQHSAQHSKEEFGAGQTRGVTVRTGKPTTPGETAWYKEEPTNPVVGPRSSRAQEHNNSAAYGMASSLVRVRISVCKGFYYEEFLSCARTHKILCKARKPTDTLNTLTPY